MSVRVLLFGALLLAGGCRGAKSRPDEKRPPRPVKVITVHDIHTIEREFVGLATPDDAVNLAFKIGGQVIDIPVSKGRFVRRGELIAELNPREVELTVEANRTAYEEARSQLDRMQRLLSHEAISVQEYEVATTRYAQAKSTYESSLDLLHDTRLKAPFDGVIERTAVDAFERVSAGQTIARLVNPETRTVSFTTPEGALYLLESPTTRYQVQFDNYPEVVFEARLKNFARTSADASGFPTSLLIENPDTARYPIAPGMSCRITLLIDEPQPGFVALPLSAIYAPTQGGDFVWIVDGQNRVEKRPVELGEFIGSQSIAIKSGIKAGERVVTAGVYQLHAGEQVRIIHPERP